MQIDPLTTLTVLGMAIVTYLTRVGGLVLMGHVTPSPRVQVWLQHLPGALLVSIITPAVLARGSTDVAATIVTAVVAARTGNVLLATASGVASIWLVRGLS